MPNGTACARGASRPSNAPSAAAGSGSRRGTHAVGHARARASGTAVAGDGGCHAVDDHARQRSGAWPKRPAGGSARSAGASGTGRRAPATTPAAVPAGLAVAAGAIDPGPARGVATALGPRTLAGYSRTVGAICTASESLMLCVHVKTYPQKTRSTHICPTAIEVYYSIGRRVITYQ